MGVAWASGLNLYAAILTLGIAGSSGNLDLPPALEILQDPLVLMAAGFMFMVEFFADKFPGVDTGWDALHSFIRIPAGAFLAAGAVGETSAAMELAAAIVGGTITGATHLTKASSRLMINTSPEPVSNWTASFTEDIAVVGGLILALNHPVLFLILLIVFLLAVAWLLPKLWRGIRLLFNKIRGWFGANTPPQREEDEIALAVSKELKQLNS
jgi:hypothetical protein